MKRRVLPADGGRGRRNAGKLDPGWWGPMGGAADVRSCGEYSRVSGRVSFVVGGLDMIFVCTGAARAGAALPTEGSVESQPEQVAALGE